MPSSDVVSSTSTSGRSHRPGLMTASGGGIYHDLERNRWVGQLEVGIGPDGKRLRQKVVGRTKSDVAAKLRCLRKKHDGRPGSTPRMQTVGEVANRWLQTSVQAKHPEGSPMWKTYKYIVDHHITPGLGTRFVSPECFSAHRTPAASANR